MCILQWIYWSYRYLQPVNDYAGVKLSKLLILVDTWSIPEFHCSGLLFQRSLFPNKKNKTTSFPRGRKSTWNKLDGWMTESVTALRSGIGLGLSIQSHLGELYKAYDTNSRQLRIWIRQKEKDKTYNIPLQSGFHWPMCNVVYITDRVPYRFWTSLLPAARCLAVLRPASKP